MSNTTDNEPGEALEPVLVDRNAVLDAVALFCANFDTLGERFKKQLRNTIRAVPRAPLAAVGGGFTCSCCGRNMELRVDGKFCNECATTIKPLLRAMDGALEYLESDPTLIEVSAPLRRAFAAASSPAPAEPPPVSNHVFTCAGCGRQWTVDSTDSLECFFVGVCYWCIRQHRLTKERIDERLRSLLPSPRCPKCGYVMCQQFDSRPVNAVADIATPNGKYICYYCADAAPLQPEGEQVCKCGLPKDDVVHSYTTEWQQMHTFMAKDTATPPGTPSAAAMRAAVEIAEIYRAAQDGWRKVPTRHEIQDVITKHTAASPLQSESNPWCEFCQLSHPVPKDAAHKAALGCKGVWFFADAATSPPDDAAKTAAVQILEWLNFDTSLDMVQDDIAGVAAIITRHLAGTPAGTFQKRLFDECVTANWDPERKNTFAEEIAHLHEELSEAFRAWRKYKDCKIREVNGKLEGVPIEFADALIGMFYNAELHGFDLLAAIETKHRFNLTRNYVREGRQLHVEAATTKLSPEAVEAVGVGYYPVPAAGDDEGEKYRSRAAWLREGLLAARDALVPVQHLAGQLPYQDGYSATMTPAELQLSKIISQIDKLLLKDEELAGLRSGEGEGK